MFTRTQITTVDFNIASERRPTFKRNVVKNKWINSLLYKLAARLNFIEIVETQKIEYKQTEIQKAILQHIKELECKGWKPSYILVGPETERRLQQELSSCFYPFQQRYHYKDSTITTVSILTLPFSTVTTIGFIGQFQDALERLVATFKSMRGADIKLINNQAKGGAVEVHANYLYKLPLIVVPHVEGFIVVPEVQISSR